MCVYLLLSQVVVQVASDLVDDALDKELLDELANVLHLAVG